MLTPRATAEKRSGKLGQSAKLAFSGQETDHEEAEVHGGVQAQGGFGGTSGRWDGTARSIASRHDVHLNQVSTWKTEAHEGLLEVFADGKGKSADRETERLVERLYARIGELTVEGIFFAGFGALGRAEKVRLIREDGTLSLSRKCALAGVSRSSLYYEPRPEDGRRLELLPLVDGLYMEFPYSGTRRVSLHLRREGHDVGRGLGASPDGGGEPAHGASGAAHLEAAARSPDLSLSPWRA